MDSMPRSKDRSRGELEKLRELSFKEKIWYIWNYYNYHIIGVIVGIAVVISLYVSCNSQPNIGLSIAWTYPYADTAKLEELDEYLGAALFDPESNLESMSSYFYLVSDDPQVIWTQQERLFAMLAAGDIDLFILDEDILDAYCTNGILRPLEDVFSTLESMNSEIFEQISSRAVYRQYTYDDGTKEERLVAIKATDSPLFNKLDIKLYDDAYLALAISISHFEDTLLAILEFFTP